MQLQAQLFLDGKQIDPSELSLITIKNPNVDKIVNNVARRCGRFDMTPLPQGFAGALPFADVEGRGA